MQEHGQCTLAPRYPHAPEGAFPHKTWHEERHQYRAKVQPVGDHCEVSLRLVDVWKVAENDRRAWTGEARRRPQEPEVRKAEDAERALRRARQMLRLRATHLGVDRLFTLTSRGLLTTRDEALAAWVHFGRLLRTAFPQVEWIAVPEPHKSGSHWHIHFATVGYLSVNVLRKMWHAVLHRRYRGAEVQGCKGAESPGNVDVSYRGKARGVRLIRKIAGYLAKYMGKAGLSEIHRKRYWQSMGIELPKAHHLWLRAGDMTGAIIEATHRMGHWPDQGPAFEVWCPSQSFAWYWVDPGKLVPPF